MTTIKKFAKSLAGDLRKSGFDNPVDYKEILRELRKICPEIKGKKKKRVIKEFLDTTEINRFLGFAYNLQNSRGSVKVGLLCETYIKTGARNSELCNLRVENINFSENYFIIRLGKGQKDRVGLLPEDLVNKLKIYLGNRSSGYLFLNERGNPFSERSIQQYIKRVRESCNIFKEITPHSLRHTYASLLIEWGVDIRKIQILLGHENLATTEIYTHLEIKSQKNKDEIFKAISGATTQIRDAPVLESKKIERVIDL